MRLLLVLLLSALLVQNTIGLTVSGIYEAKEEPDMLASVRTNILNLTLNLCCVSTTILFLSDCWLKIIQQEAEILAKRGRRVREIEEMLQVLEQQMDRHRSGEKVLPDDRLSSLTKRINVYEDQLIELSRELTDEVCVAYIYMYI